MIDHNNKLIFVHLEKTGGTSIEKKLTNLDWWWVGQYPLLKNLYKYDNGNMKHLSLSMSKIFYKNFYDNYKKFIIVRHPYTLFVSKYFHFNRNKKIDKISKKDIINLIKNSNTRWNIKKLHEFTGDKENYDYVIKFENLSEDYRDMCKKFNINKNYYELPHLYNSSYNKKKDFLSKEAKEAIRDYSNVYARIFGYDF
jgi:hypothetical protein